MSIQRPLGPIGHCSARLRRLLAIEEEAALGRRYGSGGMSMTR